MEILLEIGQAVSVSFSCLTNLYVVVIPSEHFARLQSRQKFALGDEIGESREQAATDEINSVVVGKIHGSPPEPGGVEDEKRAKFGEGVAHEQSLNCSTSGVQRGEGAENHGGGGEGRGVEVDAEQLIDGGKTGRRARHRVIGRSKTVHVLIPRRRAREDELDHDTNQVHVAKRSGEGRGSSRGSKKEHES